jgi:DNA repair exonuclease SbcCD ATPase subunit
MANRRDVQIKIRRITIRNYKGIDEFEMDFPIPKMPSDPDIFVMGSRNGLGKTSIIECCSLLLLALSLDEERFKCHHWRATVDIPDMLIKAGSRYAEIKGDIVIDDESISFSIKLDRHGSVMKSGESFHKAKFADRLFNPDRDTDELVAAICGFSPNPVIENTFLLFHSYRKVQEGNPELGMMVERGRSLRYRSSRSELPMSAFKLRILRSLMRQANFSSL